MAKIRTIAGIAIIWAACGVIAIPRKPPPGFDDTNYPLKSGPPKALAENATANQIKFQPVLDYDKDSCYNVPAINATSMVTDPGLSVIIDRITEDCRDREDLDNQNVYVRTLCNNGWCAYLYDHYFEKDIPLTYGWGIMAIGHRFDWENVVVIVKDGDDMPTWVARSDHTGYVTKKASQVRFQGTHAKLIYHKREPGLHYFRFTRHIDDGSIQNHKNAWIRGALIGWEQWPSIKLRDALIEGFSKEVYKPKLAGHLFQKKLSQAIGHRIPEFNPYEVDSHDDN